MSGSLAEYKRDLSKIDQYKNIEKSYIATCGKSNEEYIIVCLEGISKKQRRLGYFSVKIPKNIVLGKKGFSLDADNVFSSCEFKSCNTVREINNYIHVYHKNSGQVKDYIVDDAKKYADENDVDELIYGQYYDYGYIYSEKPSILYLIRDGERYNSTYISYPRQQITTYNWLGAIYPITLAIDLITFPFQAIYCMFTLNCIHSSGAL